MTHSKEERLDVELTDEELEEISGGGRYDPHGNGYNSGNNCDKGGRGKPCQPD